MTPKQIQLVQNSWKQVLPLSDQAAALFYRRLFELAPSYRKMFTTDQQVQGRKLMERLTMAVDGLPELDSIVPAVEDLGRKHLDYDVTEEMYGTVGEALSWMLGQKLGNAFTPEVEEAWGETYNTLADVMKSAAYANA